jgi:hypothetical protein
MRGCLSVLVLAVVFVAAGTWFAGPPAAGFLMETALVTAGLECDDLEVTVETEPRWELVGGRADRVRIVATDARYRGLRVDRVAVDLRDVGLIDRRAGEVDGVLTGVVLADGPAAGLPIPTIRLTGGQGRVQATVEADAIAAAQLFERRIRDASGRDVSGAAIQAPDRLSFTTSGVVLSGRLAVVGGALILRPDGPGAAALGEVVLVEAGVLPITLRSVVVAGGRLELEGVLAADLLG